MLHEELNIKGDDDPTLSRHPGAHNAVCLKLPKAFELDTSNFMLLHGSASPHTTAKSKDFGGK